MACHIKRGIKGYGVPCLNSYSFPVPGFQFFRKLKTNKLLSDNNLFFIPLQLLY